MIRFVRETTYDSEATYKVMVESSESETITDIVDDFVRFLQAVSFPTVSIRQALIDKAEEIKDSIREDAIMVEDDDEDDVTLGDDIL